MVALLTLLPLLQHMQSVGHLLLTSVYTLYVILAVKYSEEPALVREMGKAYTDYMDRTPPFIPALTKHNKSKRT